MSDLVEIIIPTTAMSAEDVAGLLSEDIPEALRGAQIRGADVVFWVSSTRRDAVLELARATLARLAEAGLEVDPASVRAQAAPPESEWRDAWKQYFHTTHLTRRIVVVPSWERYTPVGEEIAIHIDPGQAFGTGAHATTRLVLREIEALCDAQTRVERFLDAGCGSGILAIATALLWPASTGVAVDVDPPAVEAAGENSDNNHASGRVAVSATPVANVPGTFDLILANIQADVLRALASDLAARVNPGGHMILSGLLTHQAEDVARYIAERGNLTIVGTRRDDDDPDWSSVLLHRPA